MKVAANVALIYGGTAPELSFSIRAAERIKAALDKYVRIHLVRLCADGGFVAHGADIPCGVVDVTVTDGTVKPCYFSSGGIGFADGTPPVAVDAAFPIVCNSTGENDRVKSLLMLCRIPFAGCEQHIGRISQKGAAERCGISAPKYFRAKPAAVTEAVIAEHIGFPCYIKPVKYGSLFGISLVKTPADIREALNRASEFYDDVIVEAATAGREFVCAIIGDTRNAVARNAVAGESVASESVSSTTSNVGEVIKHSKMFTLDEKFNRYDNLSVPTDIPGGLAAGLRRSAALLYKQMNLCGYAEVGFIVRDNGTVVFNGLDTAPSLCGTFAKAWELVGIGFDKLCLRLIGAALEAGGADKNTTPYFHNYYTEAELAAVCGGKWSNLTNAAGSDNTDNADSGLKIRRFALAGLEDSTALSETVSVITGVNRRYSHGAAAVIAHAGDVVDAKIRRLDVDNPNDITTKLAKATRGMPLTGRRIAIAGTVGKTSVKEMLAGVLSRHATCIKTESETINELRRVIAGTVADPDYAVFEIDNELLLYPRRVTIDNYLLPHVIVIPYCGAFTVPPKSGEKDPVKVISRIFKGARPGSIIVINANCTGFDTLCAAAGKHKIVTFSVITDDNPGVTADCTARIVGAASNGVMVEFSIFGEVIKRKLPYFSDVQISNALAAVTAAHMLGVGTLGNIIPDAKLGGSRQETRCVKVRGGYAVLVDDSAGAGMVSVADSLTALRNVSAAGRKFAVLGGFEEHAKVGSVETLAKLTVKCGADLVYFVGGGTEEFAKYMNPEMLGGMYREVDLAAAAIVKTLMPGDFVLFKAGAKHGHLLMQKIISRTGGASGVPKKDRKSAV
ncbi:hypothetical protein FACS1894133_4990 [Clostridia bacterium]|nr:hypothetical protein FACS1894133_4990 [Clostridia bacterium]